ncbi:hypothetical protein SAMN04487760_104111 [Lachnospiraceae bacterium G41]|nr:hypothetical protein SAMN04487760_104111 [Lachnospiraceae bacterium G41]
MPNEKKSINKQRLFAILLRICFIFVMLFLGLYRIGEHNAPTILMDEYGYWANGAFFTGRNWSIIGSEMNYYSYGYSFLLTVIMVLFHSTALMYKAAIVLNIIIWIGLFEVIYQIEKILFEIDEKLMLMAAFVSCVYPSIALNVHITWSETLLALCFAISVLLFLKYLKNSNRVYLVLFFIDLVYLYSVHQRSIGILVAAIVSFVIFKKTKIQFLDILLVGLVLLIGFFSVKYFKKNLLSNIYNVGSNTKASHTDYGGVLAYLFYILNFDGIRALLLSASGKALYLIVSTLGILPLSLVYLVKKIRNIRTDKENASLNRDYVYIYMLLSIVLMFGIATYYTSTNQRMDIVLYGRYVEFLIPPFIAFGLGSVFQGHGEEKKYLIIMGIVLPLLGSFVSFEFANNGIEEFNIYSVCSLFFGLFYKFFENDYILESVKLSLIVIIILLLLISLKHKVKNYLVCIFVSAIFLLISWCGIETVFKSNYRNEVCLEMQDYLKNQEIVYYQIDEENEKHTSWYVADMQIMNPDIHFIKLQKDEIHNISGYIICDNIPDIKSNVLIESWQVNFIYKE